jgi:hypothetical protein
LADDSYEEMMARNSRKILEGKALSIKIQVAIKGYARDS